MEQGKRYLLNKAELLIGRDESCDVCIRDLEASRKHCRITRQGAGFFVTDLDSSNGTYLNGNRVNHLALESGDQIRIGSTEITFQREADAIQAGSSKTDPLSTSSTATLTAVSPADSILPGSRLDEESTYYNLVTDEVEASRRFVQVGNDLRFLYHASMATSNRSDSDRMVEEILSLILDWIAADRACLMLKDQSRNGFTVKAFKHRAGYSSENDFRISKSIVNYVRREQVGVLSTKAANDKRWGAQPSILKSNVDQVLCVPIQGREEILGVIYLDTIYHRDAPADVGFNADHLRLLLALAHQAAVAIENEAYYKSLLEKERLAVIGQTTAMIAHHVKNTLQGINGGSHLIESGLNRKDLSAIEKGWQIVNRNQELISRFVIDMLIIGRPYEPMREMADLNLAIEEAIGKMESQLARRKVTCEFRRNPNIGKFSFDYSGISSSILHIFDCYLQAEREFDSGQIKISLGARNGHAQITIFDDGEKIDILEPEEALDPFGTGARQELYQIGLAVSRKIIRAHDGEISFSHPDGTGNRFVIEIPMV
jgi:two-component system NtrC family sensor kinase